MSVFSREFSSRAILSWVARRRLPMAIGVGIALRLIQYAYNRGYWMDELSLVANVRDLSPAAMFGPLVSSQLAPPGFLVAEWVALKLLGDDPFVLRLIPLMAGIASMFLVEAVARRTLAPGAVWVAVGLFGVSSDLVYFASEAKQYSTDVALALALLLMALTVGSGPLTSRKSLGLAAAGALVVWFSHPSIFVLASVGTVGLARSIRCRDLRSSAFWILVGLAWVGSFASVHRVAMDQLGHRDAMWKFWAFAFPPIPPRSLWDLTWIPRRLALLFVDPLNFDAPFDPRLSMLPAIGLCLAGFVRIGRVDPGRLALLVLPEIFTILASCLKLYPFHGRLVLFLVPTLLLAIAQGLETLRETRPTLSKVCMVLVLGMPGLTAARHAVEPSHRKAYNPYGDLRPDTLDATRFPL